MVIRWIPAVISDQIATSIKFNCFLPTLLNHDSDTTKTQFYSEC